MQEGAEYNVELKFKVNNLATGSFSLPFIFLTLPLTLLCSPGLRYIQAVRRAGITGASVAPASLLLFSSSHLASNG